MRYRLQRHDGTDCSATMVPITVLRMVPIQRYRQLNFRMQIKLQLKNIVTMSFYGESIQEVLIGEKLYTIMM